MNGLLLTDKQPDFTSHDVVAIARRQIKIKKIGHTGTLDPAATGLLVLCIGGATRLQSYLMGMDKCYEGTIRFGWATDSYDATGEPAEDPVGTNVEAIDFDAVLSQFCGDFEQYPPAFSAKKVQGVRAYELARKGLTPDLKARTVHVENIAIDSIEGSDVRFHIQCSAGTYVRSIAHDLGRAVGVPAHLHDLRRTSIGDLSVEFAVRSDSLKEMTKESILSSPHFVPIQDVRLPFDTVLVDPMQERKLLSGQTIVIKPQNAKIAKNDLVSIANLSDQLVAIAEATEVIGRDGGPVALKSKVVLKWD